jgi:putative ABC transport system permease protein
LKVAPFLAAKLCPKSIANPSVLSFETLGIRLLQGRAFAATDTTNTPNVVIINETMARRFWPSESAVGKRITSPGGTNFLEIVGVVNDVRFPASLGEPYTRLQSYRPMAQATGPRCAIALRTRTGADGLANTMRKIVAELDPEQSLHQIQSARGLVARGLGSVSLLAGLLGAFAALGLVLAGVGIYGVTSYSVVQRTGEIGIRMALGAQRADVLWLVLSNGLRVSLLGALFGLAGAWAVSRFLTAVIPAIPTRDPGILAAITIALMAAVLLACYIPARRATKVNPMEALRYE